MPVQHAPYFWTHIVSIVTGIIAGGGGVRFLNYLAKALPPLKKDAGWWDMLAYNLVKNASGLDPNTVSLKPFDGSVERRAAPDAPKP